MDIVSVKDKTAAWILKVRSSAAFGKIYEMVTDRLLFFMLLPLFALASAGSVMNSLSTSDYLLYYSLPQALGEYRPNTLFGVMNFSFRDFDNTSMILKGVYLGLLLMFTIFSYLLIKRAEAKGRKFEAFAGLLFVLIITVTSSDNMYLSNFTFNAMASLTLTVGAVLAATSLKLWNIPVVVLLISAAQIIDSRTVLVVVPVCAVAMFTARLTCKDPAKLRIMCISALAAVAVVFTVTQIMSVNTYTDLDAIKEYIRCNSDPDLKLEYVDIDKWYTAQAIDWVTYYVPVSFSKYDAFRLFIDKNNFVLLTIAFTLAYIIKAARRPFIGKDMPGSRIDELRQSLGSIFCMSKGGAYGKTLALFSLTAVLYLDIFVPDLVFTMFLIIAFCALVIIFIEKGRITLADKIDKTAFYRIALVLILSKYLIYIFMETTHYDYNTILCYVSYQSYGMIPRGVLGSLLQAVFGFRMPLMISLLVMTLSKAALLFLFAFYLYRNYRRTRTGTERMVTGKLIFLFLISPAFSSLFYTNNIGKAVDVVFIVMGLICIEFAARNRQLVWFVPILSALCVFTHQVYISMLFPAVFMILAYRAFVDDRGHLVRNTTVTVLAVLFTAASFLYFMFVYRSPDGFTVDSFIQVITDRSGMDWSADGMFGHADQIVSGIFFTDSMERVSEWNGKITFTQMKNAVFVLLVSLPMLFGFVYMLKHSSSMEKKRLPKLGYLAMGLSLLVSLLPFISDVDYGRWCGFVMMIVILVMIKVTMMQPEEKKWYRDIPTDTLKGYLTFIIVLASLFPTFTDNLFFMYMLHI